MMCSTMQTKMTPLLLIDFSKAFDSISHEYIKNTTKAFNFSDDFINKVATCLHGFKSQTLVNGCLSAAIDLLRGCRQGDPIAAYLFILSVEILLRRLDKSKFISPWTSKKGPNIYWKDTQTTSQYS